VPQRAQHGCGVPVVTAGAPEIQGRPAVENRPNTQVEIIRTIGGEIPPRAEPLRATKIDLGLKCVAYVSIKAMDDGAAVDKEDGERAHLLLAVGRGVGECSGVGFERQASGYAGANRGSSTASGSK
jgi:hypothetical protein